MDNEDINKLLEEGEDTIIWDLGEELLSELYDRLEDPKAQYEIESAMEHYVAADRERFVYKNDNEDYTED